MADGAVLRLRKADFWSSLVLIAVAGLMLAKTLTFPLEGTYAGVRNAWYVSPALFPLIVAGMLILLGGLLLLRAVREGGGAAALADLRRSSARSERNSAFWTVGGAIAAYVYGFIPHTDFLAATALFLLAFTTRFHLQGRTGGRLLLIFMAAGAVLLVSAMLGLIPGPRTGGAYVLDGLVWAGFILAALVLGRAAHDDAGERRRFSHCFWTSLVAALVLGIVFKYGLLVPLPREGVSVVLLDPLFYALRGAF